MTHRALRRAAIVSLFLIVASALALGGGRIGSTFAVFNGETTNAGSVFAAGWIGAPSAPATTVSGANVTLTWTPGAHGPITGQQLLGADNGNSSSCSSPTYGTIGSTLSATATSTTDTGRGSSANGHWFCYAMRSVTASSWTAQTAAAPVRIGFFMTGIAIGASGGTVDNNDTVAITFNQQPSTPTVSRVCVFASAKTLILGDTSSTCSSTGDSYTVGKLVTTGSVTNDNNYGATISRSGNTLTVTISGNNTPATSVGSGTWTFTPAALTSAAGSAALCTSSGSNCLPTPTGNF
ncbi:MAG TPA: hypothetical protein VF186_05895 [Gaiellaceae bacterium]